MVKSQKKLLFILITFLIPILFSSYSHDSSLVYADISEMQNYKFVTFVADGFDYGEMMSIFQVFSIWGCEEPDIAGLEWTTSGGDESYPSEVTSDVLISNVNISDYDGIIIPGGDGPANLVKNESVLEKIREADSERLILAAICHGPLVLAKAGVVNNTKVTGYEAIRTALTAAGGIYLDVKAIFDDNIVTSYTATFYLEFCWCIAKAFGAIEADPPKLNAFEMELNEGQYSDKLNFKLNVSDESRIVLVNANIRRQFSEIIIKSIKLVLNADGFYEGDYAISVNGSYCVDIYVEDEYYTFHYYENVTSFEVEVEKHPSISTNTEETKFPIMLNFSLIIVIIGIFFRKIRKNS